MKTTAFARLIEAASLLRSAETRNQSALARFLGESPQTITNWKARGIVPKDKVLEIAKRIGCDPYWLESGRGAMMQNKFPNALSIGDVEFSAGHPVDARVPVYTWAELREIKSMVKEKQDPDRENISTPVLATPKGSFALKVEQQQFKSIPPGSFVIFTPGGEWTESAIAIIRKSGSLVLRRMRTDGDLRLLVPHDDAPWQTETFDRKNDEIFAVKSVTMLIDSR